MPLRQWWWKFRRSLPTVLWWLILGVILVGSALIVSAMSP
jgi:hypothetical protein